MKLILHVATIMLGVTRVAPGLSAHAASSDAPFIALSAAWQDAWNRHDMDALSDLVAGDVDFITVGASSRQKG